jgi:hypothetical protein
MRIVPWLLLSGVVGCGASPSSSTTGDGGVTTGGDASTNDASSMTFDGGGDLPDASTPGDDAGDDAASAADRDHDGIADAQEAAWADAYFPYYSIHPSDGCKTHGVLFRMMPHPQEMGRIVVIYDVLYDADCGASGHDGDDEQFAIVFDPKRAAPEGILAVRAISHQDTPCEHDTTCGQCSGMSACGTAMRSGKAYPAVYPSKDKHGTYADMATCSGSFICDFGGCALSAAPDAPSFVNAGEPAYPLVHDLTANGFITTANGWTHMELFGFDPWKAGNFGGAGDVSKDLVDVRFVVDTTGCP